MSDAGWVLPPSLVEHARRFHASGAAPAVPRTAATVVLLRDAPGGPEAYLIRRAATMAFASGMYAFPGGSVDRRDVGASLARRGPAPQRWAELLGVDDPALAEAVVCAAVRETFEEAGVLLAGDPPVGDLDGPAAGEWEAVRVALVEHRVGLAEVLAERGLVLRGDLVGPLARWITPVVEPRRYDTFFFVAALPAGQRARDVGGEADLTVWLRPADAVAAAGAGELAMLPPTVRVLAELAGYPDTAAVLAAAADRHLAPVLPSIELTGDGASFVLTSPE
jgi:8-oxo-dGTP pyrophosphatase MutT (NUDIX family)